MKAFKKSVCFFLALLFAFTSIPFAFAQGNSESKSDSIEVIVKTNKEKYATASVAKVTVSVTNKASEPLYDINTQILFDQLTPVKEKKNTTEKHINCLNPGDSFDFSYRVILNGENFNPGFFSRGLLFLSGLFNKAYYVEAKDNSGKGIIVNKYKTTITFGKYVAENIIELAYSTNSSDESSQTADTTPSTNATTVTTTAATTQERYDKPSPPAHKPPETTRPHYTKPTTTKPRYTEPKTTKPKPSKPVNDKPDRPSEDNTTTKKYKPAETYSTHAKAYSAYISFLEANRSSIDKIDVAHLNNDGIFELVIQNYNNNVVVYGYTDQYGMCELYSAGKGKGNNMDVYYSTSENLIIATSADTGGATYKAVKINDLSATVTSELRKNNGKHEQGCYLDGQEISLEECERIIASYPNKYFVVEGNVSQAISTLKKEI